MMYWFQQKDGKYFCINNECAFLLRDNAIIDDLEAE